MTSTTQCDDNTVAIVGGGCAGILVAAHLMRTDRRPRRVVLFEPRPLLGAGPAYSTDDERHLLNAPAGAMSAFEDDPAHFVAWLRDRDPGLGASDFVPRRLYRQYLHDVLHAVYRHAAPGTELVWIHHLVTSMDVATGPGRTVTTLHYGRGQQCRAGRVILALGAPAPGALGALDVSPTFGMIRDPWCPGAIDDVAPSGDVLLLGTGLTMVDIAMVLAGGARRGTIHARSRHGLLPAEHASDGFAPWPDFDLGRPTTAREALHRLRTATAAAEADGWNWRNVIAAARAAAPEVWRRLPDEERCRLLRHLGRHWEVARHRMSEPVAATVNDLRASGRLTVGPGRVRTVVNHGSVADPRLEVTLSGPRGQGETLFVSALIDCTGPGPDPTTGSPLVAGLVAEGWARLHPSGVGLDVDEHGTLLTRTGAPGSIHTIGWCRRGAEFESTAVAELRRQADRLARLGRDAFDLPAGILVTS